MVHPVVVTPRVPSPRTPAPALAVRAIADQSTPDEPTAVLVVGAHDSGKRALVRALIEAAPGVVDVPAETYLVVRHGPVAQPQAHLPGCRRPQPYRPPGGGHDAALPRPPRRVEMTLPDPLLRHFTLVEAPCAQRLGVAGADVLGDAAERGGAVLFVTNAGSPLTRSELDVIADLAERDISVFFAIVPAPDEADAPGAGGPDPTLAAMDAHRAAIAKHAGGLAEAAWFTADPDAGDIAYLRRALIEWAGIEALRRASGNPPLPPGAGTVHVGAEAAESRWSAALDKWLSASTRQVSQRLSIEVANIHLRCVQDLVFGAGCAGLADSLDRELHALSLRATAESDTAVATVVHDVLRRVLGREPTEAVRRRTAAAVRRGLGDDRSGGDLDRVLLVTGTGGVATVSGGDALAALAGYATEPASPILPPVGLGVSGGCYAVWRGPSADDVGKARSWLQRATRAVELDLLREVARRFEAVHRSLGGLIGETVDHGILLA